MGCVCRCGDDIEAGVVSTTYRCCAAAHGYICHHSQEREECVGLEHSSSFEWRPEGNLEELHLAQPTYVTPLDREEEEDLYTELEGEAVYVEVDVHREDHVDSEEEDEGIEMGETDDRLEMWAWLEDYEDDRWEVDGDTDNVTLNLNLTEDEEEEDWG